MKNKFKTGAQIVTVGAAIAILATVAFAYTNPTGTAPSGNVSAPVNTGTTMQTKLGNLGLAGTGTGNLFATMNGWFGGGVIANNGWFGVSPTVQALLMGGAPSTDLLDVYASGVRFKVDNTGKTTIAGGLAIPTGSGTPAAGAVLTSDASGNATWAPLSTTSSAAPVTPYSIQSNDRITYVEQANGNGSGATAVCPSNSVVIGGGGSCGEPGTSRASIMTGSQPTLNAAIGEDYDTSSGLPPPPNWKSSTGTYSYNIASITNSSGWSVLCNPGPAYAFAICMTNTSLVTPSPTKSLSGWQRTVGKGSIVGQTCDAWLGLGNNSNIGISTDNCETVANSTTGGLNYTGMCLRSDASGAVGESPANTSGYGSTVPISEGTGSEAGKVTCVKY